MDLHLAKLWIKRWEGVRTSCYKDAKGIPTIGVGFNLTCHGADQSILALGLDYNEVLNGSCTLNDGQIDQLLEASIQLAGAVARNLVPNFDQLPANQQLVMTDLAFNMGQSRLAQFHNTLNSIRKQDWLSASTNLQQSSWFHQVGPAPHQRGGADVGVLGNTAAPEDILAA